MKTFIFCFLIVAITFISTLTGKAQALRINDKVQTTVSMSTNSYDMQTIQLINSSFEDIPFLSSTPVYWTGCGTTGQSSTNTQSNSTFQASNKPHEGDTYLGMIQHGKSAWRAVSKHITLTGGMCYSFSAYLALPISYYDDEKGVIIDNFPDSKSVRLRIWGGDGYCDRKELLAETRVIEHTEWKEYFFNLKPSNDYGFIMFEVFSESTNNGNLLIDNCSFITPDTCNNDTFRSDLETYEQLLQVQSKTLGENHLEVANTYRKIADVYVKLKNHKEAEYYYQKSLAIWERTSVEANLNASDIADTYYKLAPYYNNYKIASYNKTIHFYQKSIAIWEDNLHENFSNLANAYREIAGVCARSRNYKEAIKYYEKLIDIQRKNLGKNHLNMVRTYSRIAGVCITMKDYEETISYYQELLDIQQKYLGGHHLNVAITYNIMAMFYKEIKEYQKAMGCLQESLTIQQINMGECHSMLVPIYCSIIEVYLKLNNHEKAIKYYEKLGKIKLEKHYYLNKDYGHYMTNHRYHSLINDIYYDIFTMCSQLNDYQETMKCHDKVLKIKNETRRNHLKTCKNLLELQLKDENYLKIAGTYHNIAEIYVELNDYAKARDYYEKALEIKLNITDESRLNLSRIYESIADIYVKLEDYEKAIQCYQKSANRQQSSPLLPDIYHSMARIYTQLEDYENAEKYYQKSLNIQRKFLGEDHIHKVVTNNHRELAEIYVKINSYKKAEYHYIKSLNILTKKFGENHVNVADYNVRLSDFYRMIGKYDRAGYYDEQAKNIYENWRGLWNDPMIKLNQLDNSYLSLSGEELNSDLSNINETFDKCYSFVIDHKNKHTIQNAADLLLNTKGITLDYSASIKGLTQKTDDKKLINLEKELRKINKNIANAEMMSLTERINSFIEIHPMYQYRDSIISKIQRNKKLRESIDRTFTEWQEIHHKLKENEISIDIVRFNSIDIEYIQRHETITTYKVGNTTVTIPQLVDVEQKINTGPTYYALITNKKFPIPQFIHIGNEKTISPFIQTDENRHLEYLHHKPYRQELHKKIWQPLQPYLEGIETVHISPVGLLHRISFEALQDDKEQFLGEQFQFHYYSSMRDFIKEKPENHSYNDAVLMGDILYDLEDSLQHQTEEWYTMRDERGKIRRLEATLEEVMDIHKTCDSVGMKSTMLTFDKATEDTIQYYSGERAPSILHFATHGLFLEPTGVSKTGGTVKERLQSLTNPLQRSALMLYGANHRWQKNEYAIGTDEDGILTALEVTALDLRKTDLVVLSACSTAVGEVQHDTEGVFGLQRAFKLAGVDYVVASLWAVDDNATKELMVIFYKNLLQKKQDPATALRNAKETLRKREYMLRDWAGFILIE